MGDLTYTGIDARFIISPTTSIVYAFVYAMYFCVKHYSRALTYTMGEEKNTFRSYTINCNMKFDTLITDLIHCMQSSMPVHSVYNLKLKLGNIIILSWE